MKRLQVILRSVNDGLSMRNQQLCMIRNLSTVVTSGGSTSDNQSSNTSESADEFQQRIFGTNHNSDPIYQKLDRLEKARDRSGFGFNFNGGNKSDSLDGLDDSFNTLYDGMDQKLKKVATYFEFNPEEIKEDINYAFRPDITFKSPMTYEPKDLDLRKAGIRKPFKGNEFEVTTEEVLRKADFRNVRFLANFITDAGIIIKRSKTKISAKAQRKVAREIKTARAFGLMPFTTMGTKSFIFGKTMESLDEDFEYENFDRTNVDTEASRGPMRERF